MTNEPIYEAEGLGAEGEGDDRGWDGWMASLTWQAWVWVNSGSWWWTGSTGVLQSWGCKKSDMTEWLNWTDEAGGLLRWSRGEESTCQFRRRRRLGFNPWVGKILWRRKWQSTSVFLPGAFHGQRSLADYSPRGCKELDTTEYARGHTHMKQK